jgi:hypothetical protein
MPVVAVVRRADVELRGLRRPLQFGAEQRKHEQVRENVEHRPKTTMRPKRCVGAKSDSTKIAKPAAMIAPE